MADKQIDITVVVDNKGAVKSIKSLGKEVSKVGKEAEKADSKFGKFVAGAAAGVLSFATLKRTIDATFDALSRAREIEGVSKAFESMQKTAGSLGGETLKGLQEATRGLVTEFDLMQQANQAMLLGLDSSEPEFAGLAEAATKLGLATGRTATEAMSDLITGLGRASPLILDNLGITVKASEAQRVYAEKINKTVQSLSEEEKAEAFRFLAKQKILEKSKELNDVQETAATSLERLKTVTSDLTDRLSIQISKDEDLKEALDALSKTFDELDIQRVVDLMTGLTSGMVTLVNFIIKEGVPAIESFKNGVNVLGDAAFLVSRYYEHVKAGKGVITSVTLAERDLVEALNSEIVAQKQLTLQSALAAQSKTKFTKKTKEAADQVVELSDEIKQLNKSIADIIRGDSGVVTAEQAFTEFFRVIEDGTNLDEKIKNMVVSLEKLGLASNSEALKGLGNILSAGQIGGAVTDKDLSAFDGLTSDEALEKIGLKPKTGESGKSLFDVMFGGEDVSRGINEAIGAAIAEGISSLSDSIVNGGSIRDEIQGLGGSLGQALGTSIGGPVGGAIGNAVGQLAGKEISQFGNSTRDSLEAIGFVLGGPIGFGIGAALGHAFGGNSDAGANAREAFVSGIRDIIDEKNLQLVIDDELKKLDFNISRNLFNDDGGSVGIFDNLTDLPDDIEAGFMGIGDAFARLSGDADLFGSHVAAILNDELGGSLNNLQILVNQLGLSADQMQGQIDEAFLSGEISAGEFLSTTAQINNIFTQGIPDGIGLTNEAFQNLTDSAGIGRIALDALGDIGAEALEKNINSLDELRSDLLASGADAEKVESLFNAISEAGISSLEQLKDISLVTTAQITNSLENTGSFFTDQAQRIQDLENSLNNLQDKELNIKLNVSSNFDNEATKKLIEDPNLSLGDGIA